LLVNGGDTGLGVGAALDRLFAHVAVAAYVIVAGRPAAAQHRRRRHFAHPAAPGRPHQRPWQAAFLPAVLAVNAAR
jgi:hypothetical protein